MGSVRGAELVYWVFAVAGSCFFLFRLVAMTLSGIGGDDGAMDHGGDAPSDAGETPDRISDGTDAAFKLVSLQSLTGFFMTFGWAGLACQKQFGLGPTVSFLVALLSGSVAMFLTAYLFKLMGRLNSAGDVFTVQKTVGLSGSVYVRVPAEGRGQVRLVVNNTTRILDATSEDHVDLDSFVDVTVVRVVDGSAVSVRKTH